MDSKKKMSRQNNRFAGSAKTRKNLSNVDRNLRKAMKVVDSGPRMSLAEGKSGTNEIRFRAVATIMVVLLEGSGCSTAVEHRPTEQNS